MKKNMVYFVLYLIVITEMLIVIAERDRLLEESEIYSAGLDSLNISKHELPISVSIPQDTTNYILPNKWTEDIFNSVLLIPENLVSQAEIDSVNYYIDLSTDSPIPPYWPEGGLNTKNHKFESIEENNKSIEKWSLRKKGKYCDFSIMINLIDMYKEKPSQMSLLQHNNLKYTFEVYIETPRIISNDFNAKTQERIINGLSTRSKIKFLRSFPDSSEIINIRKIFMKDSIEKKDTIKFYQLAKYKYTMLRDSLKKNGSEISNLMKRTRIDKSELSSFVIIPRKF